MKKKIAILGSTGSIGKSTIDILKKNKNEFDLVLLTTNRNYKELYTQAKIFNVKCRILKLFHIYGGDEVDTRLWPLLNNYSKKNKNLKMTSGHQI